MPSSNTFAAAQGAFREARAGREAMPPRSRGAMGRWLRLLFVCAAWRLHSRSPCFQSSVPARLQPQEPQQVAWLEELRGWLRCHKRRPRYFRSSAGLNKTERVEYLQYGRCLKLRKLLRKNAFSQERMNMLQPILSEIEPYTSADSVSLRRSAWLDDLHSWLRLHKRRPRYFASRTGLNKTELEEKRQYRRCQKLRALLQQNTLSQEIRGRLQPVWNHIQQQRAEWMEDLCAWLRLHKRRPHRFGTRIHLSKTELRERLQYVRRATLRKLIQENKLSQEQLDMLQPFWELLKPSTSTQASRSVWLKDLCAWLHVHKRRPRRFQGRVDLNKTQLVERRQCMRCMELRKLLRENKLGQEHLEILQPFLDLIKPRNSTEALLLSRSVWLEELCSWLRSHKRRPRCFRRRGVLNKTELAERLQSSRCGTVRRLLRQNTLSQEHNDTLQPLWELLKPSTSASLSQWLEDLCAWLRLHKRRPGRFRGRVGLNNAQLVERRQYRRCRRLRRLLREGKVVQEHLDMLQPVWELIKPGNSTDSVLLSRSAWLEDMCSWLRLHKRRPRYFPSRRGLNKTERAELLQYRRGCQLRRLLGQDAVSDPVAQWVASFLSFFFGKGCQPTNCGALFPFFFGFWVPLQSQPQPKKTDADYFSPWKTHPRT